MVVTREQVVQQLEWLSEEQLQNVAHYLAFLRFQTSDQDTTLASDHRIVLFDSEHEREHYLAGLLAEVTEENLHSEISTGPSVGNEAW